MSNYDEVNAFLAGTTGAPTLSFLTLGVTYEGRIIGAEKQQQRDIKTGLPKTWPDGNPIMQVVITLQTDMRDPNVEDDNGQRRLFVGSYGMKQAFQKALKEANVDGIAAGGTLKIRFSGEGEASGPGMNPPKEFMVRYTAPVVSMEDKQEDYSQYSEEPF